MTTGPAGIELIKKFEGLALHAYRDSGGVLTIGYGHTAGVTPAQVIDEATATVLLRLDLNDAEKAVNSLVTVPINQNQFDALVSFTFNLGAAALAHSSVLCDLNVGWAKSGVANHFLYWDHVGPNELPGLKRRRQAEYDLFLTPVSDTISA
jgi:lysozyme